MNDRTSKSALFRLRSIGHASCGKVVNQEALSQAAAPPKRRVPQIGTRTEMLEVSGLSPRGPKDRTNTRILQTMVSGIPLILGLLTRM